IVHHGLFWGKVNPITLNYRKRIKLLLENNIGLIAFHLPLDCNSECGNNAQILKRIGVSDLVSFGYYKGFPIGFMGEFDNSLDIDQICNKLGLLLHGIKYLNFGTKEIKKIAVVSGGGGSCFDEAIQKKVDLFITGDAEHTLYHMAAENKINLLFAGHYFTETFGIKAIQKKIEEEFNIYTIFCDIPTGL
ncbi:MAG: Nif3-like dinuclear metal center hexameric protein, partial [Spirochaetes bacterium GWC1_27_15]